MSIFNTIFPSRSDRVVKTYKKIVEKINALEPEIKALTALELLTRSQSLKVRANELILENKTLDDILPDAFALVREASNRTLGQRHYDVQLIGGMVINSGSIAEMKTGEGKTLMATLAAYLNALSGKGVHIITVNDYLSRRDAVWMGQIYHALGITSAVINTEASYMYDPKHVQPEHIEDVDKAEDETGAFKVQYEYLRSVSRTEAYSADITYGTNSEFGFDYLRDNLEYTPGGLRQREFNFVIVDEVDSILIDEARTPLIISAASGDSGELYVTFAGIVKAMTEGVHYTSNEKYKSIAVTEQGIDFTEQQLGISNIYSEGGIKYVHHLENAIRAMAVHKNDIDYIIKDGQVMIVDPATGRIKSGHRWSEGLHQAIEAKEGVQIQQESRTQASITFQNYFKLYPKLGGMTGTGSTSKEEFLKVYDVEVIIVPTHRPIARIDRSDLIFKTETGKFKAVTARIKELHNKGQPVLVGTVSIEKSQQLSALLTAAHVPHQLLNAKPEFAEREGQTIAQAGKTGAVTIATNMAGRGVDIKLGGMPSSNESYEKIKSLGGLFVLGTERHEARRIDNQLRGRSGRQGDPGETQFYVSLEDYLMRNFSGNDFVKKMMNRFKIPDDMPIETSVVSRSLETAQTKIEGWYFDSRKHVFEFDNVLNQQRLKVYRDRRKVLIGSDENMEIFYQDVLAFAKTVKQIDANEDSEYKSKYSSDTKESSVQTASPSVFLSDTSSFEKSNSIATLTEVQKLEQKRSDFEAISPNTNDGKKAFLRVMRSVMLQTIDTYWIEHLETMDHLRSSVGLRAYGQRDPLVEYKKEGHRHFKDMEVAIYSQILQVITSLGIEGGLAVADAEIPSTESKFELNNPSVSRQFNGIIDKESNTDSNNGITGQVVPVISGQEKVGRNDSCPCGSGKKYKKCHGIGK